MVEAGDAANMIPEQYEQLALGRHDVTKNSSGTFVAMPAMEWSTNSAGNHVNIFGSKRAREARARPLRSRSTTTSSPSREHAGDRPIVQLNHPRTFRQQTDSLDGNWDQIFDINLRDIPSKADREKKFNDFGLDDYAPLKDELPRWIAGERDARSRPSSTPRSRTSRPPAARTCACSRCSSVAARASPARTARTRAS